jgi:hypothetical protein
VFQRPIAAAIVAVWLLLFGIDFLEDTGLIHSEADVDASVDALLSNLGQAIEISKDSQVGISSTLSLQLSPVCLCPYQNFYLKNISSYRSRKELRLAEKRFRIHKLYAVFLI